MKEPKITDFISADSNLPATINSDSLHELQKSNNWPMINGWWKDLKLMIPEESDEQLKEWLKILLLGVCVGFKERNLNPELPAHQYIYPRMFKDVSDMFHKLQARKLPLDTSEMKWQVYDFGLQWIYYMDWDVYISQELY